jgi:RNA polymerase sigma factor (sigma-70 family)
MSDLRQTWADSLDTLLWEESARPPDEWETSYRARLKGAGLQLNDVLAELSDESLALAIKKGALFQEAFEELFVRRYSRYLLRWCHRWGVPRDAMRDLMQQLYCQFLQKRLATFQPDRNFRVYLYQAAWNLQRDLRRRAGKSRPLDGAAEVPSNEISPEEQSIGLELQHRLDEALLRLPPAEREVLQRTLDGQSAGAIALALKIPKWKVFQRLFRARRRLEQELGLPRSRQRESQSVP